jgi:hypothetical protein
MPAVELPEALRLEHWVRELYRDLRVQKTTKNDLVGMGVELDIAELLVAAGDGRG